MPSEAPETSQAVADRLAALGRQIRAQRKSLRVSAVAAAESAGMSRVTLHRIERGAPSVTMGAYLQALAALGMEMSVSAGPASSAHRDIPDQPGWIPARIALDHYPQLGQLAWQAGGTRELTPLEAFGIYERNWRHVDVQALEPHERTLIDALRLAFGDAPREV